MSSTSWWQTLVTQQAQGTLFDAFTTAKTVIPATALYTLPAGTLKVGDQLRFTVAGAISNIVTTPGTIVMQHMFGSTIVHTTGVMQMSTTAHTLVPFWLETILTCRVIGSGTTAKFIGQSIVHSQALSISAADSTATHSMLMGPNTSPAVPGTGFDSTVANIIDFWVGFSINNGANEIQIEQYNVSLLT